jgi:hypothetical protein
MPAPLSTPRVSLGFPPLAAAGDQTTRPGGPTTPRTEAGSHTASPDSQTTLKTETGGQTTSPGCQIPPPHRIEAGGPIASPGGPTTRPCVTPSSPASPTLAAPPVWHPRLRLRPTRHPRLHPRHTLAPASTTPIAPPAASASQLYPLHYSCRPRTVWEPPAPPLHQQSPSIKTVPMAPLVNPHLMTT